MDQAKLQHLKHLAYERRFPAGIIRADAINIPLQDGTVDLVVTSPPYFALRSYTDGGEHYDGQIGSEPTPQDFLDALWAVTTECARVLKPSGSIWVNLGDKMNEKCLMGLPWRYAIGCIDQLGLILRAEVIWSKPNGLPESVTDRVRRSHEQWFHFTKEPRYYAAVDEVREAHQQPERSTGASEGGSGKRAAQNDATNGMFSGSRVREYSPLGKLPGSVWTIPSEPLKVPDHLGVDHFAAYPQEWPRRIILGWSPPGICTRCGDGRRPVVERTTSGHDNNATSAIRVNGAMGGTKFNAMKAANPDTITGYACQCPEPDAPTRPAVVLDPFGGTGTTSMVARALGRYPVHMDLSADYLRLAQWRIFRSSHDHKTIERTNEQHPDRPLVKRQLRPKDLKAAKKAGMEYG